MDSELLGRKGSRDVSHRSCFIGVSFSREAGKVKELSLEVTVAVDGQDS